MTPRALLVCLLAAPAAASQSPLFDGSRGQGLSLSGVVTPPAPVAGGPLAAPPAGDLYYFSPEDAAKAAKTFAAESFSALGYTFDRDVPPDISAQMRGDLAFIASIRGSGVSSLHQQIYGQVDGGDYTRFFESRVRSIGMNSCGNGNAVACVIPLMGPSKMWLTQNYIRFSHPQIARLMVVFHEARHTEIRHLSWGHARCPAPFRDAQGNDMRSIWTGASLAGEPACDTTAFGSYGSSTIMLKNISKFCASCTDKVRMDAALYADDELGRIIDPGARKQIEDDLYR